MAHPFRSASALPMSQAVAQSSRAHDTPQQRHDSGTVLSLPGGEEGRAREAIEFARRELATDPRDPDLLLLLGRSLFAAGDFAGAQRPLIEAMMLAPSDMEPCVWLARATFLLGDSYRTVRLLRRAMALGAIDDQVAELYARAHLAWEQKKKATPPPGVSQRASSRPPPPAPVSSFEAQEEESWEALRDQAKTA